MPVPVVYTQTPAGIHVPTAANNGANTAAGLLQMATEQETYEPARVVGASGQPALDSAWTTPGAAPARFWRDNAGRVWLAGQVARQTGSGSSLFRLPEGYRPSYTAPFPALVSYTSLPLVVASLNIDTDGYVGAYGTTSGQIVILSLNGISFNPTR